MKVYFNHPFRKKVRTGFSGLYVNLAIFGFTLFIFSLERDFFELVILGFSVLITED